MLDDVLVAEGLGLGVEAEGVLREGGVGEALELEAIDQDLAGVDPVLDLLVGAGDRLLYLVLDALDLVLAQERTSSAYFIESA